MSDSSRSQRHGQSFMGLLVVLLVLTLLTAFAATKVDLTRYRSDGMVRRASVVFVAAGRTARQQRTGVLILVDSVGKRLGTVRDRNGNGVHDASEPAVWTALGSDTDILDPPRPLPGPAASTRAVAFPAGGGSANEFVLYLTSDPGTPEAWRAVRVSQRTGLVQVWRYDGTRWARGRA